jgi:CBS domain-containing protein
MDIMIYPVASVRPDQTVLDAISVMVAGSRGTVLVCSEGLLKEVMGIVTTSGVFNRVFAKGLDPRDVKVSEIMTPSPLITIRPDATTKEAASLMIEYGIRRLPVVKDGALVGIVTSKDLLRCVE